MYERISPLSVCMHLRTVNFYQAWAPLFQLMSTRTFRNFFPLCMQYQREREREYTVKKGYSFSRPYSQDVTNQTLPGRE
jgi:hypothetical protein